MNWEFFDSNITYAEGIYLAQFIYHSCLNGCLACRGLNQPRYLNLQLISPVNVDNRQYWNRLKYQSGTDWLPENHFSIIKIMKIEDVSLSIIF
jgi:hypothetical protein